MTKNFFKQYNNEFKKLISINNYTVNNLLNLKNLFIKVQKENKKILIFGNGGSAAIANHFMIDLMKNLKIRCQNFNESSTITCLANDFGYENWIKKVLEDNLDYGDLVIMISSSGESKNIINACRYVKKMKNQLVTFTGFKKNNSVNKLGDINFWVNSKKYNHVENAHQFLLLSVVDSLNI